MTYGQLNDAVHRLAGGLVARGYGQGDVLAIMAPNSPEYAVAFLGAAMAGLAVTTLNPTYTDREAHHQLADSGARLLVTVPAFLETALAATAGTGVEAIHVIGDGVGVPTLEALCGEPLGRHAPVELDDLVALPYSSGTTGLSKGVMLSHRNLVANLEQARAALDFGEERMVAVLPFFHIYGLQVILNLGLSTGSTVVTLPRFDLEAFLRLTQEHRATRAFVAPPIVLALAKEPAVDGYDLSSMTQMLSGAAPLSAELAGECEARIGCEVVQGYGMTELSPVSHVTVAGQFKPGSVGVTIPNTELQVIDVASGEPLGVDADGEVWVRGPQVMRGYLNNPTATAETIDADGWLHTGDIGHVDEDGHLYVVDRLKELIKYKGFQVPPAELEGLLLTHPAVADAAVIGLPDDEAGEVPAAYVALKPDAAATADEILAFVAGQVAHYKRLDSVTFVDAIPKSASGKILRRTLREQALAG